MKVIAVPLYVTGVVLFTASFVLLLLLWCTRIQVRGAVSVNRLILAGGNLAFALAEAIQADWPGAGVNGSLAVLLLWFWWLDHKRRKDRAPLALGAKSKALRDALVRRMRQVAKPRPVLRPAPRGVR